MVERGLIRAGDKGPKGEPRKLIHWRLTSKDEQTLVGAAKLWGGEVKPWDGQFELYTKTDSLPIMLLPGHTPSTWYELWSKGGCQRRCDGVHEIISDSACLCGEERECKPHTRLSVLLPDLPGIGSWLLSSTGWNAAAELAGAADLLQRASAQGVLVPARLRLEQRTSVQAGQTRRFAVPVIDVDVSFRELLGAQGLPAADRPALPSGYTPLAGNGQNGPTLEQGLAITAEQQVTRTSRSAAPIPTADDDVQFGEAPVPVPEDPGAPAPPHTAAAPQDTTSKPLTKTDAKRKLNALVGQLRESGHITTEQLYSALAKARKVDVTVMIDLLSGAYDEQGVLHWSALRDSMTKEELQELHGRLARLWVNVQPQEAA